MNKEASLQPDPISQPSTLLSSREAATKSIGSDFETADSRWHTETKQRAPWDIRGAKLEYVQTGRQALAAIATQLRRRGHDRVVFPGHFCESMTSPFSEVGFNVVPVPLLDSVRMDLDRTWDAAQKSMATTVVFGMLYFGEGPSQSYSDLVRELSLGGVAVIEDETHRVFRPGGVDAEFAVGSLRKLLPVADGAYIRHRNHSDILSEMTTNTVGDRRWAAMDAKSLNKPDSNVAMQEANSALENGAIAAHISERSMANLYTLDYTKLGTQRTTNADALHSALAGSSVPILERDWTGIVPSHLVVKTGDARRLQHELAKQRIYCPIHWPAPADSFPLLGWRNDLLSIPIDHRYQPSDMERVALAIRKIWV